MADDPDDDDEEEGERSEDEQSFEEYISPAYYEKGRLGGTYLSSQSAFSRAPTSCFAVSIAEVSVSCWFDAAARVEVDDVRSCVERVEVWSSCEAR